jgi:MOSC domain-containing protein YiiM
VSARVVSVSRDAAHRFSKPVVPAITLLAGLGVEGDAHCGATVRHRSRVAQNPDQPNLRQVHLIQAELFAELRDQGFDLAPGELGENILTEGLDLLSLPTATELLIGPHARVCLTGLRNPCSQIDAFRRGLLAAVLARAPDGQLVRKAGVMGVVLDGGVVSAGDAIEVRLPPLPHTRLERV